MIYFLIILHYLLKVQDGRTFEGSLCGGIITYIGGVDFKGLRETYE